MIDITALQIITNRVDYDRVAKYMSPSSMDKQTIAIKKDLGKYFNTHPDVETVDFDAFRSLFFNEYHRGLKKDTVDVFNKIIKRMEGTPSDDTRKNIINSLISLGCATKVAAFIDDYQAGEEIDIVEAVYHEVATTREALERTTSFEFADLETSSIAEGLDEESGLPWCLDILNETYRPNQAGDCTIIAARPGCGKTTFLCHNNVTFAAGHEA